MNIDLRSDTVTRPTPGMMEAMMNAALGDDVFGDDPTVNALESKVAKIFGMEAALFCASGTMANQVAIKVHTQPGDEVICNELSHVYYYEGGGIAMNSGASVCLLHGDRGRINAQQVKDHINPVDDVHRPLSRLVSVENTMNKGGGSIYDFRELQKIGKVCADHGLRYHLDGARLFNALAETTETTSDYGKLFHSISICLSKGLGAPVGSVLVGSKEFITKARRIRKVFGGGMRQAGILAAAGIYALDNHVERLKHDHRRARQLGEILKHLPFVESIVPIESNLLFFNIDSSFPASEFLGKLKRNNIHALALSPQTVRFVTHIDFTDEMLMETERVLKTF
ncbi:MAG: aminotransferase class I/II-fold pyridoxal phosphate-dependent enzyme [Bacteroidetes bacterium]|nr:aminotransferase class I/II-fold pyridoxal phosphate-dependent enzyme [Bacteroidota bacterium]